MASLRERRKEKQQLNEESLYSLIVGAHDYPLLSLKPAHYAVTNDNINYGSAHK